MSIVSYIHTHTRIRECPIGYTGKLACMLASTKCAAKHVDVFVRLTARYLNFNFSEPVVPNL